MNRIWLMSILMMLAVTAAGETKPDANTATIARWISELGSDDFKIREAASESLLKAGPAAVDALRTAAGSADAEVANRAAVLLAKLTAPAPSGKGLQAAEAMFAARQTKVMQARV